MNLLTLQIQREIEKKEPISFARFMELALYAPELGYYERQTEIGRAGDFYTSVSVGELFGEMLALQFSQWLTSFPGESVQIVETGAHKGRLAGDILRWLRVHQPELFARLEYLVIEPSPLRRQWQQAALAEFSPKVRWTEGIESLVESRVNGIIFSNELLDAMPVHRLRWNAADKVWEEWKVDLDGTVFTWQRAACEKTLIALVPLVATELAAVLPDGFTIEIAPQAIQWWRTASRALRRGKLLTIDYGLIEEEFFVPERGRGTLRAYYRHQVTDKLLENVGEQDLTAHVNFSAIQRTGEAEGLQTEKLITQSKFLTQIFEVALKNPETFEPWTPARIKQFQTLTHPEHLGRAFRVLVQSKEM